MTVQANNTLQVRYRPVALGRFHKYIVYKDAAGVEFEMGFGPEGADLNGDIVGTWDVHGKDSVEYQRLDGGAASHSEDMPLPDDMSASEAWSQLKSHAAQLNAADVNYNTFRQNSNSSVDWVLNKVIGVQPQYDDWGEKHSPASGDKAIARIEEAVSGTPLPEATPDFQTVGRPIVGFLEGIGISFISGIKQISASILSIFGIQPKPTAASTSNPNYTENVTHFTQGSLEKVVRREYAADPITGQTKVETIETFKQGYTDTSTVLFNSKGEKTNVEVTKKLDNGGVHKVTIKVLDQETGTTHREQEIDFGKVLIKTEATYDGQGEKVGETTFSGALTEEHARKLGVSETDIRAAKLRARSFGGKIAFIAPEIGYALGSTWGRILGGDNAFKQVAYSSIGGVMGRNAGRILTLDGRSNLSDALEDGKLFEGVSDEFKEDLGNLASSAVAAALLKEVTDALDLNATEAGILSSVALPTVSGYVTGAAQYITGNADAASETFSNTNKEATNWSAVGTALAYYAAGYAANKVKPIETKRQGTLSAIGSAIGTAVGKAVGATLSTFASLAGPVGAFLGAVIGAQMGRWSFFGGRPSGLDQSTFDETSNRFKQSGYWNKNSASMTFVSGLADSIEAQLNRLIAKIGKGKAIGAATFEVRQRKKGFWLESPNGTHFRGLDPNDSVDIGNAANQTVTTMLYDRLTFTGPNIIARRAWNFGKKNRASSSTLEGILQYGERYDFYLKNTEEVNAAIAAAPNSVYAQSWLSDIALSHSFKLNKLHADDVNGVNGWASLFSDAGYNLGDYRMVVADQTVTLENVTDGSTMSLDSILAGGGSAFYKLNTGESVSLPYKALIGTDENTTLTGSSREDWLISGDGDNALNGGRGRDSYTIQLGVGHDTITESKTYEQALYESSYDFKTGYTTKVVGYETITNADNILTMPDTYIFAEVTGGDLKIYVGEFGTDRTSRESDQSVTIKDWRGQFNTFYVGSQTYSASTFLSTFNSLGRRGTTGDDVITELSKRMTLWGDAGNDTLNASRYDDTLIGGTGNDSLNGGRGRDTYTINLGDGHDIITDADTYEKPIYKTSSGKFPVTTISGYETIKTERNIVKLPDAHIFAEVADGDLKLYVGEVSPNSTSRGSDHSVTIKNWAKQIDTFYVGKKTYTASKFLSSFNSLGHRGTTSNETFNGGINRDTYFFDIGDGHDIIIDADPNEKPVTSTTTGKFSGATNTYKNSIHLPDTHIFAKVTDGDLALYIGEVAANSDSKDADQTVTIKDWEDQFDAFHIGENTYSASQFLSKYNIRKHRGSQGNDTFNAELDRGDYIINLGEGHDTIINSKTASRSILTLPDTHIFAEVAGEDLKIYLGEVAVEGDNKRTNRDLAQSVTIKDWSRQFSTFHVGDKTYSTDTFLSNFGLFTGRGSDGDDVFNEPNTKSRLYGGDGNDTLSAGNYSDTLNGGAGNDTINAGGGDDSLIGSTGNDILNGGRGHDSYIISLGDGHDTITEVDTYEKPIYKTSSGKPPVTSISGYETTKTERNIFHLPDTHIFAEVAGGDLNLYFGEVAANSSSRDADQTVTVKDWAGQFDTFYFGDERQSTTEFMSNYNTLERRGSNGDDTLNEYTTKAALWGDAGNDTLNASGNEDTLVGGTGNDGLNGGLGRDTYIINLGDGHDTITDAASTTTTKTTKVQTGTGKLGNPIYKTETTTTTTVHATNVLKFGADITNLNIHAEIVGTDLIIGYGSAETTKGVLPTQNQITIRDWDGQFSSFEIGGENYSKSSFIQQFDKNFEGTPNSLNIHYGSFNIGTLDFSGGKFAPITLDLAGDGLSFIDDKKVWFDVDGDGVKDLTSWVGASDGLLAYDKDLDGKITDNDEIGYTNYVEGAETDLEGLRAFDTNGDGWLSIDDEEFAKFRVWQDKNSNGISEEGELFTLDHFKITRINLTAEQGTESQHDNFTLAGTSVYELSDGSQRMVGDVAFHYDPSMFDLSSAEEGVRANLLTPEHNTGAALGQHEGHYVSILGSAFDDILFGDIRDNLLNGGKGDDTIRGYSGKDRLNGGNGNDNLRGGGGNDRLKGGRGDDVLKGGSGDDRLNGGEGQDLARYDGDVAGYSFALQDGYFLVTDLSGVEGADRLQQIETLRFADGDWAVDLQKKQLRMIEAIAATPSGSGSAKIIPLVKEEPAPIALAG